MHIDNMQYFADNIGQISLLWQRIRRDILIEESITPADKRIIYGLFRGDLMTKTQLADAIVLEHSSLTRSMIRLESKGFIYRTVSDVDRRHILLSLTESGLKKAEIIREKFLQRIKPTFPKISNEDIENINKFLEKMVIKTKNGAPNE